MSDYNSSLPIRTENVGDVKIQIADATVPSQQLKVNSNGSTDVNVLNSITLSGSVEVTNDVGNPLPVNGTVTANAGTGTFAVSAAALPLPSGASTSALQTSGNASLSSIDTKVPALGQALAAASVPVVLTASQLSTLTPPTTVTVTQATGTNLHAVIDSGTVSISGTPNVAVTSTVLAANAATDRTTAAAPYSNRLSDGAAFYDARQVRSLVFASDKVDVSGSSITVGFAATTKINDYNTVASVAVSATSTHTYTSTGNFNLNQIETGASGKMKIEVQVNGATKFVKFTSASVSNASIILQDPILVTTGQTVTVIRTNKDNAAQDVYSTISGYL